MDKETNTNLQGFVDRLVRLKREAKELSEVQAEVKSEIKSVGFDVSAVEEIVNRIVAKDELLRKRKQRDEMARVYAEAIGQLSLFA